MLEGQSGHSYLIRSPFCSLFAIQAWVLGADPVARIFALVPELFGDVSYCQLPQMFPQSWHMMCMLCIHLLRAF